MTIVYYYTGHSWSFIPAAFTIVVGQSGDNSAYII